MDGGERENQMSHYPTEGEINTFAHFLGRNPDDFDIDILR